MSIKIGGNTVVDDNQKGIFSGSVNPGQFTTAELATLSSGWDAAENGTIAYNTDDGALNIWNHPDGWNEVKGEQSTIVSQPVLFTTSQYPPATISLTTAPVVSLATQDPNGSKWYKDGVEIQSGAEPPIQTNNVGTYTYKERWVGNDGIEHLPEASIEIIAPVITKPVILAPDDQAGISDPATAPWVDSTNFLSSTPAIDAGTVFTWDKAVWQIAQNSDFTSSLNEKSYNIVLAENQKVIGAGGIFNFGEGVTYYLRVKYTTSDPATESAWSDVVEFITKDGLVDGWTLGAASSTFYARDYYDPSMRDLFSDPVGNIPNTMYAAVGATFPSTIDTYDMDNVDITTGMPTKVEYNNLLGDWYENGVESGTTYNGIAIGAGKVMLALEGSGSYLGYERLFAVGDLDKIGQANWLKYVGTSSKPTDPNGNQRPDYYASKGIFYTGGTTWEGYDSAYWYRSTDNGESWSFYNTGLAKDFYLSSKDYRFSYDGWFYCPGLNIFAVMHDKSDSTGWGVATKTVGSNNFSWDRVYCTNTGQYQSDTGNYIRYGGEFGAATAGNGGSQPATAGWIAHFKPYVSADSTDEQVGYILRQNNRWEFRLFPDWLKAKIGDNNKVRFPIMGTDRIVIICGMYRTSSGDAFNGYAAAVTTDMGNTWTWSRLDNANSTSLLSGLDTAFFSGKYYVAMSSQGFDKKSSLSESGISDFDRTDANGPVSFATSYYDTNTLKPINSTQILYTYGVGDPAKYEAMGIAELTEDISSGGVAGYERQADGKYKPILDLSSDLTAVIEELQEANATIASFSTP